MEKTQTVFRLSETDGYGEKISPKCKIEIINAKGVVYLGHNQRNPVGTFSNLRMEDEVVLADIVVFEKLKELEKQFTFAISGIVLNRTDDEIDHIRVLGIAAQLENEG